MNTIISKFSLILTSNDDDYDIEKTWENLDMDMYEIGTSAVGVLSDQQKVFVMKKIRDLANKTLKIFEESEGYLKKEIKKYFLDGGGEE